MMVNWTKLDCASCWHPKVTKVGNEAWGAFVRMVSHCGSQLTDGVIEQSTALLIAGRQGVLDKLVDAGLLERDGERLRIHDYLEFNASRAQVAAWRKANAEKQRRWRKRGGTNVGSAPIAGKSSDVDVSTERLVTGLQPVSRLVTRPGSDAGVDASTERLVTGLQRVSAGSRDALGDRVETLVYPEKDIDRDKDKDSLSSLSHVRPEREGRGTGQPTERAEPSSGETAGRPGVANGQPSRAAAPSVDGDPSARTSERRHPAAGTVRPPERNSGARPEGHTTAAQPYSRRGPMEPSESERRADVEAVAERGRLIDPALDREPSSAPPEPSAPSVRLVVDLLNDGSRGAFALVMDSNSTRLLTAKIRELFDGADAIDVEDYATLALWACPKIGNGLSWATSKGEAVSAAWLVNGSNLANAVGQALAWWRRTGHRQHRAALDELLTRNGAALESDDDSAGPPVDADPPRGPVADCPTASFVPAPVAKARFEAARATLASGARRAPQPSEEEQDAGAAKVRALLQAKRPDFVTEQSAAEIAAKIEARRALVRAQTAAAASLEHPSREPHEAMPPSGTEGDQ